MLKKFFCIHLSMSHFAFQLILCLYTCLSVSDEPMGVLLVLVGACESSGSEQWSRLAGQE